VYLSRLEIIGFKSFAHKTVLSFNDGITAIVGPNGCGKSNVIDAIRWAIGEQKASVLRSDKMENVIFNGTGRRKPLGMAEVSLTIENTKGILPTEYSEVTITRRLFRNGDSEYLLNKTQCRLRDIVDLFMDTGMGANAYSVIELKMIETILSDRTEERRRLFEEAAGVTRYKVRRREALRKLESTQEDLARVGDIVKEVSRKVGSLERQAKRAEEFQQLDADRRRLEIELLEREYSTTLRRIAPLETQLAEARTRKDSLDTRLAQEEAILTDLEREQGEIEIQLGEAQKDLNDVAARIARTEQEQAVAAERVRSLRTTIERAERDVAEAAGALEVLGRDRGELEQRIAELAEHITVAEDQVSAAQADLLAVEHDRNQCRVEAARRQQEVIDLLARITEQRTREERSRLRLETIAERMSAIEVEVEEMQERRAAAEEEMGMVETELERARRAAEEANAAFEAAQERKAALQSRINELRSEALAVQGRINARQSKLEFLGALIDSDESVRFLFGDRAWSPVEPVTVGEVVGTAEEYRPAIAAALGAAAQYLVVPGIDAARRGMASLAEHRKGKATFVCLDRVQPTPAPAIVDGDGYIGWAEELTTSSSDFDALRRSILAGTLIVADLDHASAAVAGGVAEQAVTLDGVLVGRRGVVRGGSKGAGEGATIGKREQMERLERELEELHAELLGIESAIAAVVEEHAAVNLSTHTAAMRDAQAAVGAVERRRAGLEFQLEDAEETLDALAAERERLEEEGRRRTDELATFDPEREAMGREQREAEELARTVVARLEQLDADVQSRSRGLNERQMTLVTLRGEDRGARAEQERIARDRENAERTIETGNRDRDRATEEVVTMEGALAELADRHAGLLVERDEANVRRNTIAAQQGAKREEIARHAERMREERRGYESAIGLTHELEMKIAELRTRAEGLVQRGREELEIEVAERTAEVGEVEETKLGDLREELRGIKGQIRMLGSVNLLAYDEWKEESERLNFLTGQVEDLRNAERSLTETIREINDTAQTRFMETFEAIRKNFRDIFTSLFHEGDEADLALGEGDPLEAHIEITAKPRGKRPHSIDLLSGGEKTLTAIALLFAIYLVKPSPFCILDEVDAPLDDANIDRFIQLVRRFVRDTQFIIVTHNKRTMSAADTMYGVTQEEDGVSKIVSVRFTEQARRGGVAQAA